jgi:hypothetical protein
MISYRSSSLPLGFHLFTRLYSGRHSSCVSGIGESPVWYIRPHCLYLSSHLQVNPAYTIAKVRRSIHRCSDLIQQAPPLWGGSEDNTHVYVTYLDIYTYIIRIQAYKTEKMVLYPPRQRKGNIPVPRKLAFLDFRSTRKNPR